MNISQCPPNDQILPTVHLRSDSYLHIYGLPKAEYIDISHCPPNDQNLDMVHLTSD